MVPAGKLMTAFTRAKWLADRNTSMPEPAALADFLREGIWSGASGAWGGSTGECWWIRWRGTSGSRRPYWAIRLGRSGLGDPAGGRMSLVRFAAEGIAGAPRATMSILRMRARITWERLHGASLVPGFSAMAERTIREGVRRLAQIQVSCAGK